MADTIDFRYGALIRTGPKLLNGGKWDATLDEYVRNATTNADLTIRISVYFQQINPKGATGKYNDSDSGTKRADGSVAPQRNIQAWDEKKGEFQKFTARLVSEAQKFWNGIFWLQTPSGYSGLNWPDDKPKYRCHLYCKFKLSQVTKETDAHYTIAVVRVADSETFRSHSRLYSQKDIDSKNLISNSTTKFFTHFHEVGHLLGLGHVGWQGHRNLHGNNSVSAYGVTIKDMQDVMGKGSVVQPWHALPWQQAAGTFTGTKPEIWKVHLRQRIAPTPLAGR